LLMFYWWQKSLKQIDQKKKKDVKEKQGDRGEDKNLASKTTTITKKSIGSWKPQAIVIRICKILQFFFIILIPFSGSA
jgi:hypothetical protein